MYKEINKCRICGNENLETVIFLGEQKLTGVFPKAGQEIAGGPLELIKCCGENSCGLVQLKHSYDSNDMYGMNYGYRSGLNKSMVDHLRSITEEIENKVDLKDNDLVIDIGSNDSTLLRAYSNMNMDFVGMDPSGEKFKKYYPERVELIPDFFSAKNLKLARNDKKAKVVTSIAMFYDLENPIEFAKEVYEVLDDKGIWVFEQSYLPLMIEATSYDTICHEHIEFYGLKQIKWITDKAGFKIIDVELNDINGGSFKITVSKQNSKYIASEKVSMLLEEEQEKGYSDRGIYQEFVKNVEEHRNELLKFIQTEKAAGKKIFGYGASTKGNVLLQYCELTKDDIIAIAEVNEDKFGHVTPGTEIPIISEQEAKEMNPDYFIVLPWHFKENILERERKYINSSDCAFVFPLPKLEIIRKVELKSY